MRDNFISCMLWVAKGVAKSVPDEVKLSPEELKELIQESKDDIRDIEPDFEDEEDIDDENQDEEEISDEVDENQDEEEISDEVDENESEGDSKNVSPKIKVEECSESDEDKNKDSDEDIISKYDMDKYDDSDDGRPCMRINDVTMFVDNKDDEYMVDSNSDDEDKHEEKEDFEIKSDDNLLVVGHVEGDSCTVEVYVYNKREDTFYVHHQMDLAAFPVALEWMDFHPSGEQSGSYVVVGDMTPVISVWDLDVVGGNVPDYSLGKKLSKKKKMKTDLIGHTEAVISLSWNKKLRNILASGSSDKTIILWDLSNCKGENLLKYHKGNVQALEWDPFEYNYLLSGCTEGRIRIYDYKTGGNKASHKWSVEGEIERVCWNKSQSSKFLCSTDQGFVYSFDMKNFTFEHCIKAHKDNVTALDISPDYPNLLMTGGYDQFIKVWDLDQISNLQSDQALTPVYSKKTVVAKIYTAKFAPDSELIMAVGGHCSSNNLKIMDLGELKSGVESVEGAIPENNLEEEQDEKVSPAPKFQKKKLNRQQLNQNEHSVGPSSTKDNELKEEQDEKISPAPKFQKKKKKKVNGQPIHQNVHSAGSSSISKDDLEEERKERLSNALREFQRRKRKSPHPYGEKVILKLNPNKKIKSK